LNVNIYWRRDQEQEENKKNIFWEKEFFFCKVTLQKIQKRELEFALFLQVARCELWWY